MKQKLMNKIAEKKLTVGVVGLGYVGLPLAFIPSVSMCRRRRCGL